MELAYRPGWSEARERLLAFWEGAIIDRPCIAVTAPGEPVDHPAAPADFQTKWTDPDYVAASYDTRHASTCFHGEAMPGTSLMVGYCLSYGAPLHFSEQTVWQDPIIEDWTDPPELELSEDDWGWRQIQAVVTRCAQVGAGKWMTGFPNIIQPNDHLPLLRGTERFLLDLIEHPAEVKSAMRKLLDNWYVIFERLSSIYSHQEGSIGWLGLWCPWRRGMTLQSDVSCMMSPAMFEEFIAPELEEMTRWLDGSVYHLDGEGALQHLDRLLQIERLRAIQWTPGTGTPGGLYWLDLFKRIQASGKGVVISLTFDEVETAVRELEPENTFILTSAPSPDAAEALLERAVTITRNHK